MIGYELIGLRGKYAQEHGHYPKYLVCTEYFELRLRREYERLVQMYITTPRLTRMLGMELVIVKRDNPMEIEFGE